MMSSRQAYAGAASTQADHDISTPTRAVGRTTLVDQLGRDRDGADDAMPADAAIESVAPEDVDPGNDGAGVDAGSVAVEGGGDAAAPDAEPGEDRAPVERRADAPESADASDDPDAADPAGGESASADADAGGSRDATQTGEDGFRDPGGDLPYRAELERQFGMSFSGVRVHTGPHARRATRALGASAYTAGHRIAFASPHPSRELVAHELTHVVQHQATPAAKTGGIDASGEAEAEKVEAAVAAGKPAKLALASHAASGGPHRQHSVGTAQTRAPSLKANPKFGIGMAFNPPSAKRNTAEKRFSRTLWSPKNPITVPIGAVPGLSLIVEPSVKVNGAVGAGKARTVRTNWTVDGGVGVGLQYGAPQLVAVNAKLNAGAHGGFSYAKSPSTWTFAGSFAIDTNFSFGVVIGKVVSHSFNFGHCDIGKLTGIKFTDGRLQTSEMGWEWGRQPQRFFGLIKNAINNAKKIFELPEKAAKKAWGALKKSPGAAFKAGGDFVKFIEKVIPDITPWDGLLPG
jgi:Domain of unknown function (DUF4157)